MRAATNAVPVDRLRARMERAIEKMIAALDAMDADVDLEDDGDLEEEPDLEPSLAGSEALTAKHVDLEEDLADREYSLGSVGGQGNQEYWAQGHGCDIELVNEDGGDIQDEPHQDVAIDDASAVVRSRRLEAPWCGKPITAPEFTRGTIGFKGKLHPQALAYKTSGDCLVPKMQDGDVIIVEPVLPNRGELAAIWPAGRGPVVKFVESDLEGWFPCKPGSEVSLQVRLRMLNPPRTFTIDAGKIDRIWRVSQIVPAARARFHAPTLTGFVPQVRP